MMWALASEEMLFQNSDNIFWNSGRNSSLRALKNEESQGNIWYNPIWQMVKVKIDLHMPNQNQLPRHLPHDQIYHSEKYILLMKKNVGINKLPFTWLAKKEHCPWIPDFIGKEKK